MSEDWSARRLVWWTLALLAGGIVFVHFELRGQLPRHYVEPAGYRDIVNRAFGSKLQMGRREAPAAAASTGGIVGGEAAETLGVLERRDVSLQVEDLDEGDRAFLEFSFLLDDLEHPSRFAAQPGGGARLRAGFRRRKLPFSDQGVWRGSISFRAGARIPVLRALHAERELRLVPASRGRKTREEVEPLRGDDALGMVQTGSRFGWSHGGEVSFDVQAVPGVEGKTQVVLTRPRSGSGVLLHNGRPPAGDEVLRPMETGDWLVFRRGSGSEIWRLDVGMSHVISELQFGYQGFERRFHPAPGLEVLSRHLAAGMGRAVQFIAEADLRNDGAIADHRLEKLRSKDLVLSMDARVQHAAQRLIDRGVHRHMPSTGWRLPVGSRSVPRHPPRASLVVLDLQRGEVLGAGTYPTPERLDQHLHALREAAGRKFPRDLVDHVLVTAERRRERYTVNHLFTEHQIGSTIKPLFGAAVALQWPRKGWAKDPLKLHVTCGGGKGGEGPRGKPEGIGHLDVPMGKYLDGVHGSVGFDDFLARSCHSFMFELGALALEHDPAGFDVDACEGQLSTVLGNAQFDAPSRPEHVAELSVLGRFSWLTGAEGRFPEVTGPQLWNERWWDPVADQVARHIVDDVSCAQGVANSFAVVSPYRVNLDVLSIHTCHPHYSSFLKGGGTNRWSSADLAVAYARLASGRPVTGRMLRVPQLMSAAQDAVVDPNRCGVSLACGAPKRFGQVRAAVLEGMSASLERGTSKSARRAVGDALGLLESSTGARWGAYAKTGSSRRPTTVVTAVDGALQPTAAGERSVSLHVANYVLLLVECAEDPAKPRKKGQLGCRALPPLGDPVRGFVLQAWADGVEGGIDGGAGLAALIAGDDGDRLFQRLAEFAGEQREAL